MPINVLMRANLEKLALPSVAEVVEAAKAVCYR